MAMVGRVRMLLIPKSIITLFEGKPFRTQPTTQTAEDVVAALRKQAPKNCECLFEDGVLEIDLLPELGQNLCRTIFQGRFRKGPDGISLEGKFRSGLFYRIVVSAALLFCLFQGLTSGHFILAILVPLGALWVLGIHAWMMEYLNVTRESKIRELLASAFEAGSPTPR